MTTSILKGLILASGSHHSRVEGVCLLEAVAWIAGEPHSDHPSCVDGVLAAYGRVLNDAMPEVERQRLKPYIERMIGTAGGNTDLAVRRARLSADRAVRVFAVAALKEAGLTEWAEKLGALDPITDEDAAAEAAGMAAEAAGMAAEAAEAAGMAAEAAGRAADPWAEPIRLLEDLIALR